jgi:hypothetical protein
MNVLDNLRTGIGPLTEHFVPEPTGDIAKDRKDRGSDPGSHRTGFFISPLRQPRSRAELERVWKDTE